MDNRPEKISSYEALKILGKYVPEITLATISSLVAINPVFAILLLSARGIYGAWGDFGQARLNELVLSLDAEKVTFDSEATSRDEFKSIFLTVLDKHMRESSEEKRVLLRRYLISVAQGKHAEFSSHSKLLLILEQITADELRLFMLLPTIMNDATEEMKSMGAPVREMNMNVLQVQMRLANWTQTEGQIDRLLRFLGNYGLLVTADTVSPTLGGSSTRVSFKGLTDSGWAFYKFLDHPSLDKTIAHIRYSKFAKSKSVQ